MLNISFEIGTPLDDRIERADHYLESSNEDSSLDDYAQVKSIARIAFYDDLRSAPRITEVHPAPTGEFIENLSSRIYEQAKMAGGCVPYTVIREVAENFIHARFAEAVVSILDGGNTIRFSDQGPGIPYKEKAKLPGFTSAVEPMKRYIRGVGSGLPIVKDYLDFSQGTISIEDNLGAGAVVTISLEEKRAEYSGVPLNRSLDPLVGDPTPYQGSFLPTSTNGAGSTQASRNFSRQEGPLPTTSTPRQSSHPPYQGGGTRQSLYDSPPAQGGPPRRPGPYGYPYPDNAAQSLPSLMPFIAPLSQRERDFLPIFLNEGALGVTDISRLTGVPQSSTYVTLSKLEQAGLVEKTVGQKRILTDLGYHVANSLS